MEESGSPSACVPLRLIAAICVDREAKVSHMTYKFKFVLVNSKIVKVHIFVNSSSRLYLPLCLQRVMGFIHINYKCNSKLHHPSYTEDSRMRVCPTKAFKGAVSHIKISIKNTISLHCSFLKNNNFYWYKVNHLNQRLLQ